MVISQPVDNVRSRNLLIPTPWQLVAMWICFACMNMVAGQERVERFAAIEVGGSNVKYVRLNVIVNGDELIELKEMGDHQVANPGLAVALGADGAGELDEETIDKTVAFVVGFIDQLTSDPENPVLRDHIAIRGSSGLSKADNTTRLIEKLQQATGQGMDFIDEDDEVRLTIIGCVPDYELFSASLIDIGSSNTKWGYLKPANVNRGYEMESGALTVGSKTLASGTEKTVGRFASPDAFNREAKKVCNHLVNMLGTPKVPVAGMEGDTVYLSGGAVWAMVTLIKPNDALEPYVELQPEDFKAYDRQLSLPGQEVFKVNYDEQTTASAKEMSESDLGRLKDVFDPPQIRAGGQILLAFAERFGWNNPESKKKIVFARDGYTAWIMGFAEEFARVTIPIPPPLRRTWTDTQSHRLTAILTGYKSGRVQLNSGDRLISCAVENLSKSDRAFLIDWSKSDSSDRFKLPKLRTWTGTRGGSLEAAYIRKDGDHVKLLGEDGRVWRVPMNLFSSVDQDFLDDAD